MVPRDIGTGKKNGDEEETTVKLLKGAGEAASEVLVKTPYEDEDVEHEDAEADEEVEGDADDEVGSDVDEDAADDSLTCASTPIRDSDGKSITDTDSELLVCLGL